MTDWVHCLGCGRQPVPRENSICLCRPCLFEAKANPGSRPASIAEFSAERERQRSQIAAMMCQGCRRAFGSCACVPS